MQASWRTTRWCWSTLITDCKRKRHVSKLYYSKELVQGKVNIILHRKLHGMHSLCKKIGRGGLMLPTVFFYENTLKTNSCAYFSCISPCSLFISHLIIINVREAGLRYELYYSNNRYFYKLSSH